MKKNTLTIFCGILLCTLFAACQQKEPTYYKNPIVRAEAPDPSVIRAADGTFYLYATGGNYSIYKSTDMINWQKTGEVFNQETYPKEVRNNRRATLWAPEIRYIKDKYVIFYTMWFGTEWLSAIGYAVADSPTGPFTDKGILIDSKPINVEQSIDQFYYEDGGKAYLFWGSFRNIYAVELDVTADVNISIKPETMIQIGGTAYEGSNIWKRGDYYYLFASIGNFAGGAKSTYRTVVARSKNVLGPYVDKKGVSMLDNGYELILDKDDKFTGPGHNAGIVEDDAGQTWMYYHAYQLSNLGLRRQSMLDKVLWDEEGWPYIESGTPSDSAIAPIVKIRK